MRSTHAHISTGRLAHKFGVDIDEAEAVYERARQLENLLIEGVSCHIGSQLLDLCPVMEAVDRVLRLIERLRAKGFQIRHADLGGGLGIAYKPEDTAPPIGEFVAALRERVAGRGLQVLIEPGPLYRRRARACCSLACFIERRPARRISRWWTPR